MGDEIQIGLICSLSSFGEMLEHYYLCFIHTRTHQACAKFRILDSIQESTQFNSGIGIGITLSPPPQDVEFELELELQKVELNSWQFNEMPHGHTQKECVESCIQYIQSIQRKPLST